MNERYRALKSNEIHSALNRLIPQVVTNNEVYFVCIGTDRSTGDSLGGVVNVGGYEEYKVLQNTRLNTVMNIANEIVEGINKRFPVKRRNKKLVSVGHV
jgi:hypothetical protein